jgi:hypothetical protein
MRVTEVDYVRDVMVVEVRHSAQQTPASRAGGLQPLEPVRAAALVRTPDARASNGRVSTTRSSAVGARNGGSA